MSKQCPNCGSEIPDNSRFCLVCGFQFTPSADVDIYESIPPIPTQQGNGNYQLGYNPYSNPYNNPYHHPENPYYNGGGQKKKKTFLIVAAIVLAIIAIMAIGFGSWYYFNVWRNRTTYLRVERNIIESARPGVDGKIVCHSDGKLFKVAYAPTWVSAGFADSTLIYTVKENTTEEAREDSIVVVNGDLRAKIVVKQKAEATFLNLDKTNLNFTRYGGSQTVKVTTDGVNVQVNSSVAGVSAHYDNGIIVVNAASNQSSPRSGYLEVSCDQQTASIYVSQQGCDRIADLAKSCRSIVFRIENTYYAGNQAYFALYFSSVNCNYGRAVQFCSNGYGGYTAKEVFDYQISGTNLYLSNGSALYGWGGSIGSRQYSLEGFIHEQYDYFTGYTGNLSGLTFRYIPGMSAPVWQNSNIVGNIQN